jgi:hypothetical protein
MFSIEQTFKQSHNMQECWPEVFSPAFTSDKCEAMNIPKTNERTPRYSTIGIQLFKWLALALSAIVNKNIKWLSLKVSSFFVSLKPCIDGFKSCGCETVVQLRDKFVSGMCGVWDSDTERRDQDIYSIAFVTGKYWSRAIYT